MSPNDYLPAKALFAVESARLHACSPRPQSALTFLSFAALSWFDVLNTFTATASPSCTPSYTSAHAPDLYGFSGSVIVFGSIQ